MFDLALLEQEIQPLVLDQGLECGEQLAAYFQYYGLDIESRVSGVTHQFGFIDCSHYDVVCHYYQLAEPQGCCLILHGLFDHAGLYGHLIEHCLSTRRNVVIVDLPGHGLSTGRRASIPSFSHYQSVLQAVLGFFSEEAYAPSILIGQSTGAAIAMEYLLANRIQPFTKTVLLAPLYQPTSWWQISLSYEYLRWFIQRVPRQFSANSQDKEFLQFVRHKDPLQWQYVELDWIGALKKWQKPFRDYPTCFADPLVIQGTADATVDWRINIPVIEKRFPDCHVALIDAAKHHLVAEAESVRAQVFTAIDRYLAMN